MAVRIIMHIYIHTSLDVQKQPFYDAQIKGDVLGCTLTVIALCLFFNKHLETNQF